MCIDFKIRISVHPKEISTDYFRHPRTPIRVYSFAYGYLVNLIHGALNKIFQICYYFNATVLENFGKSSD